MGSSPFAMTVWEHYSKYCTVIFATQNAPLPIPGKLKGNPFLHIIHFNDITSVWNLNRLCGKCGVCRQQSPLLEWRLMYMRWALSFHWQWPVSLSFYIIMSLQWLVASPSHFSLLEHKLQKIYLFWASLLLVKQFFLCFGNHFQLSCNQCSHPRRLESSGYTSHRIHSAWQMPWHSC